MGYNAPPETLTVLICIRSIMSKVKYFVSLLVGVVFLSLSGLNVQGQCGIHFRRASTWSFPVPRLNLDRTADMTGDGLPDLLASDDGPGWTRAHIFIIPNLGNGTFGPPSTTLVPAAGQVFNHNYNPVHANNDNRLDLFVMLGDSGLPETFRVYINNGDGTFTPGPTYSLGYSQILVDLNNDGSGDYISYDGGETRYNLGNGDGSFGPAVTLGAHGGTTGDFNGDGKIDFLHSNHLHLNNGDLTWGTIDIGNVLANRTIWNYGDFNVDGKLDILTAPTSGSLSFGILTSTGAGFTVIDHPVSFDPSWIGYPYVGNWGGNAAPDIVFQPRYVAKKVVLINDGAGNFLPQQTYDGRIDITSNWQKSVMADFDNDGRVDRVRASSYISNSRQMLHDVTSFTFEKQVCDQPGQPRVVDYDRSNSTDWSFWNPATGDWSRRTLASQEGPPMSEETVNWGLGSFGDIPTPGDFDGDGITDRAVYRDSTGYWYIRRSSDLVWFVMKFGLTGDKPVVADYDGDTISDIAVWRPSDGNWYIWLMGPQQFTAAHFGSDGDKPVPADFDGDLKTDLAVYRPSTGVWYYLKSSDGNYAVVPWGISTDKPMPADFDGDGKADINVYRESDRTMYILRSSTGAATYYQWGVAGDFIQIGDYDGDFVADLGVYRPSNRSWWTTTIPPWGLMVYGVPGAIPTSSVVRFE